MGKNFLIITLMTCAFSAAAGGMDQMRNNFGLGAGMDGLNSGGFDPSNPDAGGDGSDMMSKLKGEGITPYIGIGAGANLFKSKFRVTEGTNTVQRPHDKTINKKMPLVALTIGAQQKGPILTDFGVMAMYMPGKIRVDTPGRNNITDANTIKESYRFSVYGGAGVPITPTLNVFGKLGLVYSAFSIGYKENSTANNGLQKKGGYGVAPGVMLQYKLSEAVSMNLDVSYIIYKTIKTKNIATSPTGYNYSAKLNPKILTVLLGGSLSFGSGK